MQTEFQRPLHRGPVEMERQRKPSRDFRMGEKLPEGKGRKDRDEDRRDRPASLPGSLRQPPLPSLAGWGRGPGSRGPRRAVPCRAQPGES